MNWTYDHADISGSVVYSLFTESHVYSGLLISLDFYMTNFYICVNAIANHVNNEFHIVSVSLEY